MRNVSLVASAATSASRRQRARLFARERRLAQRLGRRDAHVRVVVVRAPATSAAVPRVSGTPPSTSTASFRASASSARQRLDRGADRVGTDRHERLDGRVAEADVHRVLERRDERRDDLVAVLERRRDQRAPPCARASRRRRARRAAAPAPRAPGPWRSAGPRPAAPRARPCCRSQRTAVAASLTCRSLAASRRARRAGPIRPWAASGSVRSRRRAVSSTKTSAPAVVGHARDAAQVVAAAERGAWAAARRRRCRRRRSPRRRRAPTSRPATSTTIHLDLRVRSATGQAEARAQVDDRDDLAAVVRDADDLARRVRERDDLEGVGDLLHARDRARRSARRRRRSRRGSSTDRGGGGAWSLVFRPSSGALHEGPKVEQDEHRPLRPGGPADARRCARPARRRGRSAGSISSSGEPPDLLHLVDEQPELLARARRRPAGCATRRSIGASASRRRRRRSRTVTSLPRTLMTPSTSRGARGTSVMGGGRRISASCAIRTAYVSPARPKARYSVRLPASPARRAARLPAAVLDERRPSRSAPPAFGRDARKRASPGASTSSMSAATSRTSATRWSPSSVAPAKPRTALSDLPERLDDDVLLADELVDDEPEAALGHLRDDHEGARALGESRRRSAEEPIEAAERQRRARARSAPRATRRCGSAPRRARSPPRRWRAARRRAARRSRRAAR